LPITSPIANRTRGVQQRKAELIHQEEKARADDIRSGLLALGMPPVELGLSDEEGADAEAEAALMEMDETLGLVPAAATEHVHSTDYIETLLTAWPTGDAKIDECMAEIKVAMACRYQPAPGKGDEAHLTELVNELEALIDQTNTADPPLGIKYFPGSEVRRVAALCAKFLAHARGAGFYASTHTVVHADDFERDLGDLVSKAEHLESFAPTVAELLAAGHVDMGW